MTHNVFSNNIVDALFRFQAGGVALNLNLTGYDCWDLCLSKPHSMIDDNESQYFLPKSATSGVCVKAIIILTFIPVYNAVFFVYIPETKGFFNLKSSLSSSHFI